jgi:hypothetical protein
MGFKRLPLPTANHAVGDHKQPPLPAGLTEVHGAGFRVYPVGPVCVSEIKRQEVWAISARFGPMPRQVRQKVWLQGTVKRNDVHDRVRKVPVHQPCRLTPAVRRRASDA